MKNFTRFAFTAAILLHMSAFAQYDTGVSDVRVSTTPNNTVPANFSSSIYYTLTNVGAALTTNETIVTGVLINGDTAFGPLQITGNIPTATELNVPHDLINQNNQLITFLYEFDPTEPFHAICAFSFVLQGEDNPANNYTCHDTVFVNSNAVNDWAADELILHKPSEIFGFDLDNNENIVPDLDSLTATFTNIGNMTYTERTRLNYRLGLAGDTTDVEGTLSADLGPGESTTRIINNPAILPVVPQDSGTYRLCAIANAIGDNVPENNVSCDTFNIIDSYNPFAPGNWPTGEEEIENQNLSITPIADQVLIQGIENTTSILITDMQGKVIEQMKMDTDGKIMMSERASGVYVIQATDNTTGETLVKKVSK